MQEKVITWATPVFFLLIALELLWGWHQKRNTYRLNDAITSIGLGVLSQVAGVFTRILRVGIYALIFHSIALFHWDIEAWWALPAALVFYDFCYYWHHRFMHRIAIMWAAHVVHHSSEDYNLSTALRQTSTGALFGWIPYVPMAIAGVPPTLFAIVALIDLLYQFWVHTEHIGKLGWFDRVFVSPSNHRVHHGVNDDYLDKNYGGILAVWDRCFGTFTEELDHQPVVYGTRSPLHSFNPLRANLEVYQQLAHDSRHAASAWDKARIWFMPPGWRPAELQARMPRSPFEFNSRRRYDPGIPTATGIYVLLQFAVVLGCAVHFLEIQRTVSGWPLLSYLAFLTVSMVALGALLEGRQYGWFIELARLATALLLLLGTGSWFAGPILTDGLLTSGILWSLGSAVFGLALMRRS